MCPVGQEKNETGQVERSYLPVQLKKKQKLVT
jgi:hypothetical protein